MTSDRDAGEDGFVLLDVLVAAALLGLSAASIAALFLASVASSENAMSRSVIAVQLRSISLELQARGLADNESIPALATDGLSFSFVTIEDASLPLSLKRVRIVPGDSAGALPYSRPLEILVWDAQHR
jgi:Tfp pilus assembly protein PilV